MKSISNKLGDLMYVHTYTLNQGGFYILSDQWVSPFFKCNWSGTNTLEVNFGPYVLDGRVDGGFVL